MGLSPAGMARCALVAAALQCVGCQSEAAGADVSHPSGSTEVREAASPDVVATSVGGGRVLLSAIRPALDSGAETRHPSASAYLATESTFITPGAISSETSDPILESMELFSKAMQSMREEEGNGMEALGDTVQSTVMNRREINCSTGSCSPQTRLSRRSS